MPKLQDILTPELRNLLKEARLALDNVGLQDAYIDYDFVDATKAKLDAAINNANKVTASAE